MYIYGCFLVVKVLQKQTKKKKPTFQHKKQKRGLEKKPHVKEDKESKERFVCFRRLEP